MMHEATKEKKKCFCLRCLRSAHGPFALQLTRFASQNFIQALLNSLIFPSLSFRFLPFFFTCCCSVWNPVLLLLLLTTSPRPRAATTSSRGTVGVGGVDQNDRVENHTNCTDIKIRMWRKTMRMAAVGKPCKQWHILERLYMHVGVKLCQDHVENYSIRQSQIEIGSDMGANTNLHVFFSAMWRVIVVCFGFVFSPNGAAALCAMPSSSTKKIFTWVRFFFPLTLKFCLMSIWWHLRPSWWK